MRPDPAGFFVALARAVLPPAALAAAPLGDGAALRPVLPAAPPASLPAALPEVELTLLVGGHAQAWALGARAKRSMTATVAAWRDYLPAALPTPHPSWRNTAWLKRNPWFEDEVVPYLRLRVEAMLAA